MKSASFKIWVENDGHTQNRFYSCSMVSLFSQKSDEVQDFSFPLLDRKKRQFLTPEVSRVGGHRMRCVCLKASGEHRGTRRFG